MPAALGDALKRHRAVARSMVRDPVCGMEFSEEEAESLGAEKIEHEGKTLYFCCPMCRDEFLSGES